MRRFLAASLLVLASWCGAQERALDKEVLVPAPIDAVWAAWTTRACSPSETAAILILGTN